MKACEEVMMTVAFHFKGKNILCFVLLLWCLCLGLNTWRKYPKWRKNRYVLFKFLFRGQMHSLWLGYIVNSGIGLSYRPAGVDFIPPDRLWIRLRKDDVEKDGGGCVLTIPPSFQVDPFKRRRNRYSLLPWVEYSKCSRVTDTSETVYVEIRRGICRIIEASNSPDIGRS